MPDGVRLDLVFELRRLLDVAGSDELDATAAFDALVDAHGRSEVGAALAVVTAEYYGSTAALVLCRR
jgi:hypothetical protein